MASIAPLILLLPICVLLLWIWSRERDVSLDALKWGAGVGFLIVGLGMTWIWGYMPHQRDVPYPLSKEKKTDKHRLREALLAIQKNTYLHAESQEDWILLAETFFQNELYQEAAQTYARAEKIAPLHEKDILQAVESLLRVSKGMVPPKVWRWLDQISPSSPFYPQALALRESLKQVVE